MKRLLAILTCVAIAGCQTSGSQKKPDDPTGCVGDDCQTDQVDKISYRKVERSPDGPDAGSRGREMHLSGFEPFDPEVPDARLDGAAAPEALQQAGVDSEPLATFRGDFASEPGEELAIITESAVEVRSVDGDRIARKDVGTIAPESLRAVRLVDERLELAFQRQESDTADTHLVVARVIGRAVAEVFVHDVQGSNIEFVRRGEEKAIQVGEGDEADIYLWNRWEGVFRIPKPVPTAPR